MSLHEANCELESRRKRVCLIEGGMSVHGATFSTGHEFDVMRRYQSTDGEWCLALGNNGRVQLPCVEESKVQEVSR